MAQRAEVSAKLTNCKLTAPEPDSEGKIYVTPDNHTIILKADDGCTFETDGTFAYQGEYNSQTDPVPASHTDSVTFKLADDFDYYQFEPVTLTMSATKKEVTPPTPKPEPEPNPEPDTPTQPTTPTQPKTQLDVLKNSLRIPLDLKDDDTLLQSYLDSAKEYIKSMLDEDDMTRLDSKRAQVVVNEIATLLYENRGDETVVKDFPFTLRALINQLKY